MLLIQNTINNEFLNEDEIEELTGAKQLTNQVQWLIDRDWQFELNRKNRVMVGRWYARLKLSGIELKNIESHQAEIQPNFGSIR